MIVASDVCCPDCREAHVYSWLLTPVHRVGFRAPWLSRDKGVGIGRTSSRTMRLQRRRPRAEMRSAKPSTSASAILRRSPPLSCLHAPHQGTHLLKGQEYKTHMLMRNKMQYCYAMHQVGMAATSDCGYQAVHASCDVQGPWFMDAVVSGSS